MVGICWKDIPISSVRNHTIHHQHAFIQQFSQNPCESQLEGCASGEKKKIREMSRMVPLIEAGEGVRISEKAKSLLEEHGSEDMMFIGVWGRSNHQNIHSLLKMPDPKNQPHGLLHLSVEGLKKPNGSVFLIQTTGYEAESGQLTNEERMTLELLMIICSAVLVVPHPADLDSEVIEITYKQFSKANENIMKGQHIQKHLQTWPRTLCYLGQQKIVKEGDKEKYESLFLQVRFIDVNRENINVMSEDFMNAIMNVIKMITSPCLSNVRTSGNVLKKLLPRLIFYVSNNDPLSTLPAIFHQTIEDCYETNHLQITNYIEREFGEDPFLKMNTAKTQDEMFEKLEEIRNRVYAFFYQHSPEIEKKGQLHEQYQDLLTERLEYFEQLHLQSNHELVKEHLQNKMFENRNQNKLQTREYFSALRQNLAQFDGMGRVIIISQYLKDLGCQMQQSTVEKILLLQKIQQTKKEVKQKRAVLTTLEKQNLQRAEYFLQKQEAYQSLIDQEQEISQRIRRRESVLDASKMKQQGESEKIMEDLKKQLESLSARVQNARQKRKQALKAEQQMKENPILKELEKKIKQKKEESHQLSQKLQQMKKSQLNYTLTTSLI